MIWRALVALALVVSFSNASAQVIPVVPVGAAQAAAVAMRTYTLAEIEILTSQSGVVRAGTATLRGGYAFPVIVSGALITGALAWFYNQAQNSTNTSLDAWYNWNVGGPLPQPVLVACAAPTIQERSAVDYFNLYPACQNPYGDVGTFAYRCPNGAISNGILQSQAQYTNYYNSYVSVCFPNPVARPSLPDWIRGTYTPPAGQTAVPHPDALTGLNTILTGYIPTIPMPTPSGNPSAGISIGAPQPTQDVWEDGCNSGTDWNGTVCLAPDPLTQPCAVGFYRPFAGAVCEVNPNPEPACGTGLYRPYAGAACQAIQPACEAGYSRPNIGGACALNPVSPAPIATTCEGMTSGDGVVGFVVAFFPNMISLTKCMFVPTRDIPSRVTQLAAYGKTKFPFSVAVQLQSAFAPVVVSGDASVLPTNAGFFTLDWAWLTPLWALIKIAIGSYIHFSVLWFMWGKLSPQVVV